MRSKRASGPSVLWSSGRSARIAIQLVALASLAACERNTRDAADAANLIPPTGPYDVHEIEEIDGSPWRGVIIDGTPATRQELDDLLSRYRAFSNRRLIAVEQTPTGLTIVFHWADHPSIELTTITIKTLSRRGRYFAYSCDIYGCPPDAPFSREEAIMLEFLVVMIAAALGVAIWTWLLRRRFYSVADLGWGKNRGRHALGCLGAVFTLGPLLVFMPPFGVLPALGFLALAAHSARERKPPSLQVAGVLLLCSTTWLAAVAYEAATAVWADTVTDPVRSDPLLTVPLLYFVSLVGLRLQRGDTPPASAAEGLPE
jgi:hypothetical protein